MSSMLRISEATALALHAVVYLAASESRRTTQAIADRLGASSAHLSKVLQRLASVGIVSGTRGPRGGFVLASNPEELRLLEVFEAVEGPFSPSNCLFPSPVCDRTTCIMGGLLARLNGEILKYLETTSIAELTPCCMESSSTIGSNPGE